MKIGVFFDRNSESTAHSMMPLLQEGQYSGSLYKMNPNWDQLDGGEIRSIFSGITHFVIASSDWRARWVAMVAGYFFGRGSQGCLLWDQGQETFPFFNSIEHCSSIDEVIEFLSRERDVYLMDRRVDEAREYLINSGLGLTDSSLATQVVEGKDKEVLAFLDIGFSPDAIDNGGVPLLVLAARHNQGAMAQLLLDRGATLDQAGADRGNTALMEAAVRGDEKLTQLLIEAGANPNLTSSSGQTALMMATGEGFDEVVKAILQGPVDLNIVDQLGMTALKYAELFKHQHIVELLKAASGS